MSDKKGTVHEGRILIRTPYNDTNYAKCKSIPGGKWNPGQKAWSYPLAWDVWQAIDRQFPDLERLPNLEGWIESGKEAVVEATARALAKDATLVRLPTECPTLAGLLRPDQRVGAEWVAHAYRGSGLVADEPGVGKTMLTIAGIIESGLTGRILVACPKLSVKPVWWMELARAGETVFIARGTRARRDKAIADFEASTAERKWLVIVAEMLRAQVAKDTGLECMFPGCEVTGGTKRHLASHDKLVEGKTLVGFEYPALFAEDWDCVVVDESHKLFGSLTVVKGNLAGRGIKNLPVKEWDASQPFPRRIAMSGTPFGRGGRVQGMFGTLHWLWPDEFTSFWKWADRHFDIEERVINRFGKTVKKINGLREGKTEADFYANLGPRILRRTKAEVLPWLPPKQYVTLMCEMTPKQVRQYKGLVDDGEIQGDHGFVTADGTLAGITRAKQLANGSVDVHNGHVNYLDSQSGKVDMLFQQLEERGILSGDGDRKVLVASQFNEFLDFVAAELKAKEVPFHMLTGASSDTKRDKMMKDFQADGGARVFLINSKAGGVSVTLDAADEVHCLDTLWDPGDNQQLEDRAHRASRMHQVTIYIYVSEGTIDEVIAKDVEGKRFQQFKVLDGRLGRQDLRDMITYRKPKEDNEEDAA